MLKTGQTEIWRALTPPLLSPPPHSTQMPHPEPVCQGSSHYCCKTNPPPKLGLKTTLILSSFLLSANQELRKGSVGWFWHDISGAVAVRERYELEQWDVRAAGAWPGISLCLYEVSGPFHMFLPCRLIWGSLKHRDFKVVGLLQRRLRNVSISVAISKVTVGFLLQPNFRSFIVSFLSYFVGWNSVNSTHSPHVMMGGIPKPLYRRAREMAIWGNT